MKEIINTSFRIGGILSFGIAIYYGAGQQRYDAGIYWLVLTAVTLWETRE